MAKVARLLVKKKCVGRKWLLLLLIFSLAKLITKSEAERTTRLLEKEKISKE